VPASGKYSRTSFLFWLLAGSLFYLSFGYTEMQGSDLWWHIAAGREIIQNGSLWLTDSWSFKTANAAWVNHEWLADILYYNWVLVFGLESLVYWKWLVLIATYVVLQISLSRNDIDPAAGFICAAAAVAIAAPFIDIRPHLYSLLGFSVLIFMLLNRTTSTWKLALLFVVWVNVHGGFIFGLMALAIFVFPWRDISKEALTRPAKIVLVCTLACLVNPDGINSFILPLTYALDADSPYRTLGEWLAPFKPGGIQAPLFIWALYAVPVIALSYAIPYVRRATGVPWEGLALCGLTLLMSLTSRRFIPLFAISMAVMSAPLIGFGLGKLRAEKVGLALAVLALGWGGFRMLPYPLSAGPAYHYLTAEYVYPIDMFNYVEANDIRGNVFALYNWGGYIHWRTGGKLKVFIDGRANTVYDDDTYNQYVAVLSDRQGWLEFVESSEADFFLWPYYQYGGIEKLKTLLSDGRWKLVYQDSVSYLLVRSTVRPPGVMKPSPATAYRSLTQAQLNAFGGDFASTAIHAERVLAKIPWQKSACLLARVSHRKMGNEVKAEQILQRCRGYFPSRQLR
jgi:hypothetical protein